MDLKAFHRKTFLAILFGYDNVRMLHLDVVEN